MLPIEEVDIKISYLGNVLTGPMPCRAQPSFPVSSEALAAVFAFWQGQFPDAIARRFVAAECGLLPRTVKHRLANPGAKPRAKHPAAHPTAQPLVIGLPVQRKQQPKS